MTELQQNRYDKLLRRVGGLIGPGSMVNDALTELFPTIDVESLNAELSLPLDWRLGFASDNLGPTAGQLNLIQLFNPAASGNLVVLERVDLRTDSDQFVAYATVNAALTNVVASDVRDTREGIQNPPTAEVRDVTQVGGIANIGLIFCQTNVIQTIEEKRGLFVLAPGTGVTFVNAAANTSLMCSFFWRERAAEASELQFG